MKRSGSALRAAIVLGMAAVCLGSAAGRFDQRLPLDRQPIHVLNRLTFGPRPADVEQVRRIGIDKWIDQQLHPEQIVENPVLEAKLKPLDTLQMAQWQIMEKYPVVNPAFAVRFPGIGDLPQQQTMRLLNGSVEERKNTLAALDADTRRRVLASGAPQMLEGLPAEIQEEATQARKTEQEERQKEFRRLMPPLSELLQPEQMRLARQGTKEEKLALINSFDSTKRQQV